MPKFKTFRRSIIFGSILATFLPIILLGFFSYSYLSYKIEESNQHNNELIAANVATEISAYLHDPLVTLSMVSVLLKMQNHEDSEINDLLHQTVAESDLLEIIYIVDGSKIVKNIGLANEHSYLLENYLGIDMSGLSILRNIEYLQAPYWTQSFLSPISGKKSIAIIYPDGTGRYLVGLFNIGYFHSIIASHSRKAGIETIVLDEKGKPVFHPDLKIVEEQQNFANIQPNIQAQIGDFGTFEFELDNIWFIGSTANIPETKWLVVVTQPLDIAYLPVKRMRNGFILALFFSLLIVVPLALRQSKRLLKPLRDLQENIKAVADGDYGEIINKQSHEEFEQVASHFRVMAAAIERRKQLLEINEERLESLLELHNTKQLGEDELLEFALEQAVKLARSEVGFLVFLDSDERSVARMLWSSAAEAFCERYGFTCEKLESIECWKETLHHRRYVIKNEINKNINRDDKDIFDIADLRQLSVPIFNDSKIVAVVGVYNKSTDYDATDARQLSLYISNTWDIIEQKQSHREKEQLSEKLAQAQKLEAIGTLAGGIAHDFNNVLMVILGNTELAREHIHSPEKIEHDLDQIFTGALRARDLVNQILVFSRNRAGGLKPFDIKPIIKEAVKLLRSSIPANITIRPDIATECKPILAEPGQINQLIMNLGTNAVQAMEDRAGVLGIMLRPVVVEHDFFTQGKLMVHSGEYMVMIVSDTGRGIEEKNIERLFDPYFTTREKEQGTGLGLAVVHGIVKSLKGAIAVESERGKGSKFTIYLPVAKKESSDESQILVGNLPRGDEHILYVDDDEAVAEVNSKILENLGYSVSKFSSSRSALDSFYSNNSSYDLVISDMDMPEMTGEDLTRLLLEHNPETPIIICTGFSEKMDEKRAKELGIRELLTKPLTKTDLALTVRKVLGY